MNALQQLVQTSPLIGPLLVRVSLAVVMFPHGAQKMLGLYGGHGYTATMHNFTQGMHIPAALAFLVIFTEFFGSIALFFGFVTRLAALGMAVLITVAAVKVHLDHGFFMNWTGNQKGEGFEYHLLVLGMSLALTFMGAGCCSIDRLFSKKYVS